MFKRRHEPEPTLETKILQTIAELEDNKGNAVTHAELSDRQEPCLTTKLERITAQVLIECCKTNDTFWADRLTAAGREALEA